jgi:DNA-binding Lrp family transcriptional regulator
MMPSDTKLDAVNLSAPAVQRRVRRLEASGVISSNVAVIDPARVGRPITIIVEVEVVSEKAAEIDALKHIFKTAPDVQQCYYVTGEFDFVLVITAPTMAAYEAFTRQIFFSNPNVRRFRTLVAMDLVKVGLDVPFSA